ncbi:hypothetical protein GILI108418_10500 [Gillisia limnaea]
MDMLNKKAKGRSWKQERALAFLSITWEQVYRYVK